MSQDGAGGALFLNLTKANDVTVVLNVQTFLGRLEELAGSSQPDAAAALALLDKRGLTPACLAQARALLDQVQTEKPDPADLPDYSAARAAQQEAMKELWAWYKDWAQTARQWRPIYDGTMGDCDDIFFMLWAYLGALGVHEAKQVIFAADGAKWSPEAANTRLRRSRLLNPQ